MRCQGLGHRSAGIYGLNEWKMHMYLSSYKITSYVYRESIYISVYIIQIEQFCTFRCITKGCFDLNITQKQGHIVRLFAKVASPTF